MKILFLTRKYPPQTGGMENQSYNLIKNFKELNGENNTFVIANKKGNKFLIFFLPYSFFKALYIIWKNKITHLHLSDGLLAFEGYLIKKLTGVKTAITIHGLDITYKNKIYQNLIPYSVSKLDKLICVSNNTKKECIKKGIPKEKIVVIPNGINPEEFIINKPKKQLRKKLESKLNLKLENKKILLTVGRLIKRKGVEWFVLNVMTKLKDNYIYLIAGEGEERENIEKAIEKNRLQEKVFLLGKVNKEMLKLLYNSADLFIMPNIKVRGDAEGFGIVALESGSCGLPVIASNIEGLSDAVINGETGWLVEEKNAERFVEKIETKRLISKKVIGTIHKKFSWNKISKEYSKKLK